MSDGIQGLPVFCVNLKSREDRLKEFIAQSAVKELQTACKFQRFEAVVGKEISLETDTRISLRTKRNIKMKTRRDHEDINTMGAVGCYLSHYGIWKQVAEGTAPYALIFEDDIKLPDDFLQTFQRLLAEFKGLEEKPDVWTMNYGWNFYYKVKGRTRPQDIPSNFKGSWLMNTTPGGTGSYLITKEGAAKLVKDALPLDMHVDMYIAACADIGKVNVVANKELLLSVLSGFISSDISPYEVCTICDIPTNLKDRFDITWIAVPAVFLGGAALFWWKMRPSGRRRR